MYLLVIPFKSREKLRISRWVTYPWPRESDRLHSRTHQIEAHTNPQCCQRHFGEDTCTCRHTNIVCKYIENILPNIRFITTRLSSVTGFCVRFLLFRHAIHDSLIIIIIKIQYTWDTAMKNELYGPHKHH